MHKVRGSIRRETGVKRGCGTALRIDRPLLEDSSDQPQMTERVHHSALEHALDRVRSVHCVLVLNDWTVLSCSRGQSLSMHCDGVVHKQLDPHRREARGIWAPRAVLG